MGFGGLVVLVGALCRMLSVADGKPWQRRVRIHQSSATQLFASSK
jgi:hypothetical protein